MNKELFDMGMTTRKAVLGDEHVLRSMRSADDFTRDMQELVIQYCWGDVWNRQGLDRRARSMLNLAMMVALNRPHELALHVRGAIRNGVTKDEIKEIFLQAAVYCGVPAGIDAFRTAKQVLDEMASAAAPTP